MKQFLIIKAGSTLPTIARTMGDFEDWTARGMGIDGGEVCVVSPYLDESLPDPESYAGIVVTGSHAMVTDREAWSERSATWTQQAVRVRVPFLGICYGHQLLAHAMGGTVDYHPLGREVGTVEVNLSEPGREDPLLGVLPGTFLAHASHAQTVTEVPEGARVLASNDFEPHHAFVIGEWAWGIQFHPEFSADAMRAYIDLKADDFRAAGKGPDELRSGVRDTPLGDVLLRRFVELARRRERDETSRMEEGCQL